MPGAGQAGGHGLQAGHPAGPDRAAGRTGLLFTSDGHAPYAAAIKEVYGIERPQPRRPGPGRPPKPKRVMPPDLCYATVRKRREKGRVAEVVRMPVFGTPALRQGRLGRSAVSTTVNTSFVERHNGTDRHQNGREHRKTYGSSREITLPRAASYSIGYSCNFCWCVRTLRVADEDGHWPPRTPAMAAGLTDRVWSLWEWITFPARPG